MKKVKLLFLYSLQTNTFCTIFFSETIFDIFFTLKKSKKQKQKKKPKNLKTNKNKNTLSVCVKHFAQPPSIPKDTY